MRSPQKLRSLSLLSLLLAGLPLACGNNEGSGNDTPLDEGSHHHNNSTPQGRLLISDGAEGRVIVLDLEQGKAIESLSTEGAARVYASSNGMRGFAVQGTEDIVQGIDSGLHYESHGDHFDVESTTPRVLSEIVVSCSRPVHFVPHHGYSAAFCDGDGMLHVFEDTMSGDIYDLSSFDSGRPHHGVGLVAFDHVIVSTPNPEDEEDTLPIGVRALNFSAEEKAAFDECPGLHGEAANENHVCFGCTDGVLCIHEVDSQLASIKLDNPSGAPAEVRVGTLKASGDSDVFLGNWGEDLVVVDLKNEKLSVLEVGRPHLAFAPTHQGDHVLVLTAQGELLKIDVKSGKEEASASVFPKFEVESGHSQLKPTFVVSEHHVYVVDPRHAELYEFELDALELTDREFHLEKGQYNSLALVAAVPQTHEEH